MKIKFKGFLKLSAKRLKDHREMDFVLQSAPAAPATEPKPSAKDGSPTGSAAQSKDRDSI